MFRNRRNSAVVAAVAVLAACGVTGSVAWSSTVSRTTPAATVIHLLGAQTRAKLLPLVGKGFKPGNEVIATDDLLAPPTHKTVGTDSLVLKLGADHRFILMSGTVQIAGHGSISLAGRFGAGRRSTFAVIGGTGDYAGATGTATDISTSGNNPDILIIRLLN